jgi:ubiquinone biosynthesis protein UbiJ
MKPTPIGRFVDTPSYEELQEEIARLRLTDEERAAIAYAELTLRCETHPVCERHTATLRSLLKRLEVRS